MEVWTVWDSVTSAIKFANGTSGVLARSVALRRLGVLPMSVMARSSVLEPDVLAWPGVLVKSGVLLGPGILASPVIAFLPCPEPLDSNPWVEVAAASPL